MKKFATQIYDAVKAGTLAEPFDATMVRRVTPARSLHADAYGMLRRDRLALYGA
jgi:hypothetical protein